MADDHESAIQFENTYDVLFHVGTPPAEQQTNIQMFTERDKNTHSNQTSTDLAPNSKHQASGIKKFERNTTENINPCQRTISIYNQNNAINSSGLQHASTPLQSVFSYSPRNSVPVSPISLTPGVRPHWSLSPRSSPTVSAGPSPRSMSPASPTSPVLTNHEIMEAYAAQEKTFQEEFLKQVTPMTLKSPPQVRSHSSSPCRSQNMSVGIDHLENLVRLMEQLSSLKEENATLRKKCTFLRDTKDLLQVQNEMLLFRKELAIAAKSLPTYKKPVRTRSKRLQKGHHNRPYFDIRSLSTLERRASDSSNDAIDSRRDRPGSAKLSQRSQSVGSINVDATIDLELDHSTKHVKTSMRDKKKLETMFSKSLITSKWNQVKKVFSGKPETPTKTETACVSAEQLVRANSKHIAAKLYREASIGGTGSSPPDTTDNKHSVRPVSSPDSTLFNEAGHRPSLVAEDEEYEETNPTEHQHPSPEPDSGFKSSHGSSFGSEDYNQDNSKTKVTHDPPRRCKTPASDDEGRRKKFPSPSQYLTVDTQPHGGRRQSTPMMWTAEDLDLLDQLELEPDKSPRVRRSSSFKAAKRQNSLDVPDDIGDRRSKSPDMRKSNRSAWGRVKDIIHTRKDSLKRKNKRSNSAGDMLPDATGFDDYYLNYDSADGCSSQPASPKPSRKAKSEKNGRSSHSPPRKRPNQTSPLGSPKTLKKQDSIVQAIGSAPVDVTALIGGVSEEFTKKMQEWEDKKRRSIFSKEGSISLEDESATKFNKEFIRKMEEWEKKKGLASPTRIETQTPPKVPMSPESDNSKEILSESFVKTVQEWERVKTKRIKDSGSPEPVGRRESRKSRKQDARSKSRERDRSRTKYEKEKLKGRQKIEKKEMKIEKERQKLEKLKQKLETVEMLSEAKVEGVTSEFAKRLHEWEVMKGFHCTNPLGPATSTQQEPHSTKNRRKKDGLKTNSNNTSFDRLSVSHHRSNSAKEYKDSNDTFHQRSNSAKDHKEQIALHRRVERERSFSEGTSSSLAITISPPKTSPPVDANISQAKLGKDVNDQPQVVDDSTSIDISITAETVARLEAQNKKLFMELEDKEEDLAALQDDVTQLTTRINEMNIDNTNRIDHYKRELWATSKLGRYTIETDLLSATMKELQRRLKLFQHNQQMLLTEKQQLQAQLRQAAYDKQNTEARVLKEMRQNSDYLKQSKEKGSTEDLRQIHNDFEKLCIFFGKIQEQLSDLKVGMVDRNNLLSDMQRHLMNHEVTNKLLEANVQRKQLELQYYRHKDQANVIKRWKSFTGNDLMYRNEISKDNKPQSHLCVAKVSEDFDERIQNLAGLSMEDVEEAYWEWLERLKQQRSVLSGSRVLDVKTDETQTDVKSLDRNESASQTVMTLCNIAYSSPSSSPVARLPLSQIKRKSDPVTLPDKTIPSTKEGPVRVKRQLNLPSQTQATENNNVAHSEASIVLATAPQRPTRNRRAKLIRWERRTSTDSQSSQKSDEHSHDGTKVIEPGHSSSWDRSTTTTSSPSTPSWSSPSTPSSLTRENVDVSFSFSSVDNKKEDGIASKPPISPTHKMSPPKQRSSPDKSSSRKTFTISVPYPSHTKPGSPRPVSPKSKDIIIQKHSSAKTYLTKLDSALQDTVHEETYAEYKMRHNHPPHSPMIKSRYPRKMRAGEGKAASAYMSETATWQATPPRRNLRYRKVSSEKRPDISSLVEGDLSANVSRISVQTDEDWRERAKSDSYFSQTQRDHLQVPGDQTARPVHFLRYQNEQRQSPVLETINQFERTSSSSGEVFRKSPTPGAIGRPLVSPVHRLKTAEELLQEYSWRRHSSTGTNMDRLSPLRDKYPSTSSDKENDKSESTYPSVILKQLQSDEETDRDNAKPGTFVTQAIRKLSTADGTDNSKVILQDRTNDGARKSASPDVKLRELPRLGLVSQRAEIFQSRIEAEAKKTKRQAPLPPSYAAESTLAHGYSPKSCSNKGAKSPHDSPLAVRPSSLVQSGSPQLQSPRSQRSKGYSRFFTRKSSPSSPTKSGGSAITALCKQALHVEVEEQSKTSNEEDNKRSRNKFMDSTWLQKPKRFFKVSKC